jgi:hypothetical protein
MVFTASSERSWPLAPAGMPPAAGSPDLVRKLPRTSRHPVGPSAENTFRLKSAEAFPESSGKP